MTFYHDIKNKTFNKAKISDKVFVGLKKNSNKAPEQILIIIQIHFNLKPEEFYSKTRKENIVNARKVAIYLIHHFTNGEITFKELARLVGYYNKGSHATAMHHFKDCLNKIEVYPEWELMINELKNKCNNYLENINILNINKTISDYE